MLFYLKMIHFHDIEKTKIIMQKSNISHLTVFSFRVKICLNVSFLKAQYMISIANKLHKWSPILLLIIDEDAARNRVAKLIPSSSR